MTLLKDRSKNMYFLKKYRKFKVIFNRFRIFRLYFDKLIILINFWKFHWYFTNFTKIRQFQKHWQQKFHSYSKPKNRCEWSLVSIYLTLQHVAISKLTSYITTAWFPDAPRRRSKNPFSIFPSVQHKEYSHRMCSFD